jgi:hypothetical protein
MANLRDADVMTKLISFRADDALSTALKRASRHERMSMSDLIRQCVLRTLRTSGMLDEKA